MAFLGGYRRCLSLRMHLGFGGFHDPCLRKPLAFSIRTLVMRGASAMSSSVPGRRPRASLTSIHDWQY